MSQFFIQLSFANIMPGLTYDELEMGQVFTSGARTITEADVVNFAGLSGDYNPIHVDAEFAKKSPMGQRIAHGLLSLTVASGLANQLGILEGTVIAMMKMEISFTTPVFFGDTIRLKLEIIIS